MSMKRKVLTAAAALTTIGGLATVDTGSASAATPQCGDACISIFSKVLVRRPNPTSSRTSWAGWRESANR